MTIARQIRVSTEIGVPPEAVWARISAHEDTPGWVPAVKRVTLIRDGQPHNGVGAIRTVAFKPALWTEISEKITHFDPPHEFHYELFKGMPGLKAHLGKLIVDEAGSNRSRLRWEVNFVFRTFHPFRLFVPSFVKSFERVLIDGLGTLKNQLESAAR
jgi:Polyketide cyclase / dehydrase and lipid transport